MHWVTSGDDAPGPAGMHILCASSAGEEHDDTEVWMSTLKSGSARNMGEGDARSIASTGLSVATKAQQPPMQGGTREVLSLVSGARFLGPLLRSRNFGCVGCFGGGAPFGLFGPVRGVEGRVDVFP